MKRYDVVIIGASVAGCTSAILYANEGYSVALLEKNTDLDCYKKLCTHTLQACVLPIMNDIGILEDLQQKGAVLTHHQIYTDAGWIKRSLQAPGSDNKYGVNVTRKTLDRTIRQKAISCPLVDYFSGHAFKTFSYTQNGDIDVAVVYRHQLQSFRGRLLIGADGKHSVVAKQARLKERIEPNHRFGCFAHFKKLGGLSDTATKLWYLNPSVGYLFPNENNIHVLGCVLPKHQYQDFAKDIDVNFNQFFHMINVNVNEYQKVTPFYRIKNMENIMRQVSSDRVALIGDAAMTTDPVAGLGCSWAMFAAKKLFDHTRATLAQPALLTAALEDYAKQFQLCFESQFDLICKDALAKPLGKTAQHIFQYAVSDQRIADHFLDFCARIIDLKTFFQPFETKLC